MLCQGSSDAMSSTTFSNQHIETLNVTTWHFNVYTLTVFVSEIFNTRFAALARTISATSTVHKYHLLSTKTFVDIIYYIPMKRTIFLFF